MTNEHDVSPFVFKGQYNDESAYIPYEEIANRDKDDSKLKINNDQVLPLPETAKESKGIKVGSKVLINSYDSVIEWQKKLHGCISTVIECRNFCNNRQRYKLDCESSIWFDESDLILMDDSIPISGQSLDIGGVDCDKTIYNVINKAHNEIYNFFTDKDGIKENSLLKFDIDKYNKNYTEMNIQVLKDCKDKLTDTDKPIDKVKDTSFEKLIYTDNELKEYFVKLKVGDKIKIKDKKYCGLWGKYNNDFCDKWCLVIETCPHNQYVAVKDIEGDISIIDLFVVQIMAIKDCAISEIKNPTLEDLNNLKPGDQVLLKSVEECHAKDWYDEFKACCGRWVTIKEKKLSYGYDVEEVKTSDIHFLNIRFKYIAAIRKV